MAHHNTCKADGEIDCLFLCCAIASELWTFVLLYLEFLV